MDRFIEDQGTVFAKLKKDLKSNMDRFIEYIIFVHLLIKFYLKSNMDRFIDNKDRETIKIERI